MSDNHQVGESIREEAGISRRLTSKEEVMSSKSFSVVLGGLGIAVAVITWFAWNYGRISFPFDAILYIGSALMVVLAICRCVDAGAPATERRVGLRMFGMLLAFFGIGVVVLGFLGGALPYLGIGVLILVGGVVIFSNPYLVLKKK